MTQEKQNKKSKSDEVRSYLNDIPADKVREPNMPVDAYVGEVQSTLSAARIHWARFVAIGFDWDNVERARTMSTDELRGKGVSGERHRAERAEFVSEYLAMIDRVQARARERAAAAV